MESVQADLVPRISPELAEKLFDFVFSLTQEELKDVMKIFSLAQNKVDNQIVLKGWHLA